MGNGIRPEHQIRDTAHQPRRQNQETYVSQFPLTSNLSNLGGTAFYTPLQNQARPENDDDCEDGFNPNTPSRRPDSVACLMHHLARPHLLLLRSSEVHAPNTDLDNIARSDVIGA